MSAPEIAGTRELSDIERDLLARYGEHMIPADPSARDLNWGDINDLLIDHLEQRVGYPAGGPR